MAANGLLNLLQITTPKPASPASGAGSASGLQSAMEQTPASRDAGRKFARMVNDASPRDTSARDAANARAASAKSAATSSARDVCNNRLRDRADLSREITPDDAADMLNHFDEIAADLNDLTGDPHAGDQLKEQLAQIVASNTPQSVGDMLAALTQAADINQQALDNIAQALAAAQANAQEADAATAGSALGQAASRVLSALHKAITRDSKEAPTQEAEAVDEVPVAALNPALALLQAANFQADAADAAQAASSTSEKTLTSVDEKTVAVITPLAQSAVASYTTMQRAEVDSVDESEIAPAQSMNARIPGLALEKGANDNALPEVELPKASLPNAPLADKKPAMPTSEFVRQIETLGVTAQALADARDTAPVKKDAALNIAEVKPVATNAAPTAGAFTLHAASLTQPVAPSPIAAANEVLGRSVINHAPVRDQVSVAIRQAAKDGNDEITVQLDPVELGRVEVKLHMHKDGQAQLAFLVDKPETFDALSRDARMLEQALQEAGIKADTSGMQFNLRQQQQQPQMQSDAGANGNGSGNGNSANDGTIGAVRSSDQHAEAAPARHYRVNIHDGIDIEA